MENLNDITSGFGKLFIPHKALMFYVTDTLVNKEYYIEAFDIDREGRPLNAKPLTIRESCTLAKLLNASNRKKQAFLKPKGLLPNNILYIDPEDDGFIIWQTPEREAMLFFNTILEIPNGKASIPPLIWKANRKELFIFALKENTKAAEDTVLFHAPFFNIYNTGSVCMGNVAVDIDVDYSLEEFIAEWERYFFNSYFSHALHGLSTKANIVELWKGLINSNKKFPVSALKPNGLTIKDIL